MKTLKWILTVVLLPLFFLVATAGNPGVALISLTPQTDFKISAPQPSAQASILVRQPPAPFNNDDICKHYRRHEIAGFVLLPVGIGAAVGGSFMVYRGAMNINSNVNAINNDGAQGPYVPKHDIVLVSAGAAVTIIGLVLVPTGLSMGISGAVRYRKHCGNENAPRTFYLAPATDGAGVAFKF